jgi:hypothetical protein
MMPLILFAVLAGLPILNAIILRVSAVFLFASVAIGNLLVLYLSDDVVLALNAFSKDKNIPMIVQLVLLLLPVILTLFFLRKSTTRGKFFLHLIPIIGCGLSIAVLALPMLPNEVQGQIFGYPSGDVFKNSQDLIISITGILVLLLMWRTYKHHEGKHGKKHH